MITKIISGGQNGADQGGLIAAKNAGIPTGGWMPKGFRTMDGGKPEFHKLYGMKEHHSSQYPPRTELNVMESDGTIRFAKDFTTAGEKCTVGFVRKHLKPCFDVDFPNLVPDRIWVIEVPLWIKEHNIKILNVAGNSEKNAPGIQEFVVHYLSEVFKELKSPLREIF